MSSVKYFLILFPTVILLLLWQAYFWVPKYQSAHFNDTQRHTKFIQASIGDAKILNPILNADASSSRITELVFDGLLDLDENLQLRGRLAKQWQIYEMAYLLVKPSDQAAELKQKIEQTLQLNPSHVLAKNVQSIRILPSSNEQRLLKSGDKQSIVAHIHYPQRLQFRLKQVDQQLWTHLQTIIGEKYWDDFDPAQWVTIKGGKSPQPLRQILPILEHNPIIDFQLRQGVLFHDGHEFNAWDVKFTYDALMNGANLSPRTSDFEPIKSLNIINDYRLEVVYKRLFSPAINAWTMGILPEHLLKPEQQQNLSMRISSFNRAPIGTGPFQFVAWQSDELIHLKRYADYWDGAPLYEDFYFRIIPDTITREVEFRTGALDIFQVEPYQVKRYQQAKQYQLFSSLAMSYTYIGYNQRNPLFADKKVRRALGLALNVDEMIRYVLYGEGERISGPYPKETPWYNPNVKPLPYDPKAAARLLAESGWRKNAQGWLEKDGQLFEFNLITNQGNLLRKAILTIAQNYWHKLGIKCNTQVFEWAVFLQDFVNPGKFDAIILGWNMGIDADLYQIWHSSQSGPSQLNMVAYHNAMADKLMIRIRQEYDVVKQQQLTHQLHQIIADDQPYTFLYAPIRSYALNHNIKMLKDGKLQPIKAGKGGNLFFHFNRWQHHNLLAE